MRARLLRRAAVAAAAMAAAVPAVSAAGAPSPIVRAMDQPVYGETWAGYDAIAAAPSGDAIPYFRRVHGAWAQTAASCVPGQAAQSSVWVGLGGVLDTAAVYGPLQVGTDSDCRGGHPRYFAWYEAYPEPLVRVRLAVSPGDALSASVSLNAAGQPFMRLADTTTGRVFHKLLRRIHVRRLAADSAEWIVEGPPRRVPVLTDFGSVTFTDATATQAGDGQRHTGAVDDPAWRYSEPDVLGFDGASAHPSAVERTAAPGPLAQAGKSFTVSYGSGPAAAAQ